jgi:ABC-type branched-subunit amino acid transport system substrate-binding protein
MKLWLFPFLIAAVFLGAAAQELPSASDIFSRSVRLYKAGDYDSTIAVIKAYLKEHGKGPEAEFLVPIIMEAFLRKGDVASVGRLYDLYHKKFRSSPFMARVYYLNGYAEAKERSFETAFEMYSKALETGVSNDLDTAIMRSVEVICANALPVDDLRNACDEGDNHPRIREVACYYEIVKRLADGDVGKAKKCMNAFRENHAGSRFEVQIGDQLVAAVPKKGISVGLMAPLSGDDADIGKRVSQGVQLAIDKYNLRNQIQIKLIALDTRGVPLEAARKTAVLLERDHVPLFIGPLLSSTATVAAAMAVGKETVMLTPTATDDGIAELGPNLFQMNITLGVLGRKAARYALSNLNIREFAIVAPHSNYGIAIAAAFRDEVTKSGASVFDEEYFEEGGNDFTAQFRNLRTKLLLRKLNTQHAAGAKPMVKISTADSIKYADTSVSIGAIFMPGETDDIVMLAPQVAFNRIKGQLLGSTGWHTQKTLTDGKHYVLNAIIATVFEPDSSWKKWPEFRREYAARFREEPDRVAALGFDAGNLAAKALENSGGSGKASKIAEALATTQKYEGTSGVISFDRTTRTNSEAVILKITPGGFVRVQ